MKRSMITSAGGGLGSLSRFGGRVENSPVRGQMPDDLHVHSGSMNQESAGIKDRSVEFAGRPTKARQAPGCGKEKRGNENGAAVWPRRREGFNRTQALNVLLLPEAVLLELKSLARPFNTSVPATMSCRPCLRRVQATIRKPMPRMITLRYLAG